MKDSLTQLFLFKRSADHPVALGKNGEVFTWQRFHTDLCSVSAMLTESRQQRWALCFKNSYWFAVSLFALATSGKEILIPSNLTSQNVLSTIRTHYDAILTDLIFETDAPTVMPMAERFSPCDCELSVHNTKVTLFTSGSTAEASAIEKSLENLATEIAVLKELFGQETAKGEYYATVSHQHIYGLLFRVLLPLSIGQPFTCFALEYPDQIVRAASEQRVLISSPAHLKRLECKETPGYKAIFSSGGPLPYVAAQTCERLLKSLPFEIFGSSETGGIGWRQQKSTDTPWRPLSGVNVAVNKDHRMQVKSPFIDNESWYTTSDRIQLLDNGTFHLQGRCDRIIKISEKRISLEDIEYCLRELEPVEDVVALPIERNGRIEVCAVIRLSASGRSTLAEQGKLAMTRAMRHTLAGKIEPVGVPRRFRFVEGIPVNSQGKLVLATLVELFD